ncbi:MAG: cupin domain-containing protein [Clostridiaceae bacterium]|jgi:mannose-6-phosphate isomerase-like protein (cupin superfamily)|nr:cupin domain-containing protein [Clostridiaceae bacterium]
MTFLNNYYNYNSYSSPYYEDPLFFEPNSYTYDPYNYYQYPYSVNMPAFNPRHMSNQYGNQIQMTDYGPAPFSVNIEQATKQNTNFRTALWTGDHLQLTLMSINVGEDIGLENHPNLDQFIRIEQGQGLAMMGDSMDRMDFQANVEDDFIIIIPAGKWHNIINTGNIPLKLYSIYAPPQHPHGTVHMTKSDAEAAERMRMQ